MYNFINNKDSFLNSSVKFLIVYISGYAFLEFCFFFIHKGVCSKGFSFLNFKTQYKI